ncbi:sugar phosphate isomerase/epimerase family protein [Spongiimicrobium sp. 3-5]|uniref:sugar phosphate isomerase/epimerase family protein n=1 Tax=Spongiimicrobium sp. 3-5 TaxID=3332596 RepID=UPI0039805658
MKNSILLFTLFLFGIQIHGQENKTIQFFQTDWGRTSSWDVFCEKTHKEGYDGIEIWLPRDEKAQMQLKGALKKYNLKLGLLNGTNKSIPFEESLKGYGQHLRKLASWSPEYINCHTGSDFFSFEQNKAFIDLANKISKETNIPIYHETHRGRFSFNLPATKTYISQIPELKLNLDISHWMVVHESLLENQDQDLLDVINRTHHLHARVGHAQGPQVNDPEAPEWKDAVNRHVDIWEKIIRRNWETSNNFTLTTEFGPADYMPTLPYTRLPVANQWKANLYMMKVIKERLNIE